MRIFSSRSGAKFHGDRAQNDFRSVCFYVFSSKSGAKLHGDRVKNEFRSAVVRVFSKTPGENLHQHRAKNESALSLFHVSTRHLGGGSKPPPIPPMTRNSRHATQNHQLSLRNLPKPSRKRDFLVYTKSLYMSLVDEVSSAHALFNILNQTTQNPNGVIRKIPKTNEQTTRLWLCRSGESARKTKSRSPNNWGMQQTRAHLSQAVAPCGARSGDKAARRIVTCNILSFLIAFTRTETRLARAMILARNSRQTRWVCDSPSARLQKYSNSMYHLLISRFRA